MKRFILTFAITVVCLFVVLAQNSTTLSIRLYPVQIIEHDSVVNEGELESNRANFTANTFSTSEFSVQAIKQDSVEHIDPSLINSSPKSPRNKATHTNSKSIFVKRRIAMKKLYKYSPHIVYSIEAL